MCLIVWLLQEEEELVARLMQQLSVGEEVGVQVVSSCSALLAGAGRRRA